MGTFSGIGDRGSGIGDLGSNGTPAIAGWIAPGDQLAGYLGFSVDSLSDVDKDGCSDIIGGAPAYNKPVASEGVAFAYYSSSISGLSATTDAQNPIKIGTTAYYTGSLTTGCNATYEWDFGDTSTDAGQYVSHSFLGADVYTVTLTASTELDSQIDTLSVVVEPYYINLPMIIK